MQPLQAILKYTNSAKHAKQNKRLLNFKYYILLNKPQLPKIKTKTIFHKSVFTRKFACRKKTQCLSQKENLYITELNNKII